MKETSDYFIGYLVLVIAIPFKHRQVVGIIEVNLMVSAIPTMPQLTQKRQFR